jgi:hypothetical protein
MMLYLVNALAALSVLFGFHVAFRQKRLRAWAARLWRCDRRSDGTVRTQTPSEDAEGVASVFRMAGVMIMAFSFTVAEFANLIAYYTAASPA